MSAFFFFNDTATTEIYTLSLHDALPICIGPSRQSPLRRPGRALEPQPVRADADRKSTRLNSSHTVISYAVFCLKKKNKEAQKQRIQNDDDNVTREQSDCRTTEQRVLA